MTCEASTRASTKDSHPSLSITLKFLIQFFGLSLAEWLICFEAKSLHVFSDSAVVAFSGSFHVSTQFTYSFSIVRREVVAPTRNQFPDFLQKCCRNKGHCNFISRYFDCRCWIGKDNYYKQWLKQSFKFKLSPTIFLKI